MRVGSVAITRQQKVKRTVEDRVLDFLNNDPRVQQGIARMARSEVKNYLAELAEENEMPFTSPEAFLTMVRTKLAAALLVERVNSEHAITLDDLEERHLEHDPTWKRELDETFGESLHIVRGDN